MLGKSGSRLKIRDGEAYSVQAVKNSQSEEMQRVVHQNILELEQQIQNVLRIEAQRERGREKRQLGRTHAVEYQVRLTDNHLQSATLYDLP